VSRLYEEGNWSLRISTACNQSFADSWLFGYTSCFIAVGCLWLTACLWVSGRGTLAVALYQLLHCGGLRAVDCLLPPSVVDSWLSGYTSCFIAVGCLQLVACVNPWVADSWLLGYTSCFIAVGRPSR
jgi:hypothetical protein